jgi:hypothetical protein
VTALATIRPAADLAAREHQIGTALERLAAASGATLREAVKDVPSFAKVLEGLVGDDERWQREFRQQVVAALTRLPRESNAEVPLKLGLQMLHSLLHDEGAEPAINLIRGVDVPSWADLIRVYRPLYGSGAPVRPASERKRQERREPSPMTVGVLRTAERLVRMEAVRYAAAVERVAGLADNDLVPIDVLAGMLKEPQ